MTSPKSLEREEPACGGRFWRGWLAAVLLVTALMSPSPALGAPAFLSWAERPAMGWNSWDCFATTVTEAQVKAQADYMAEHLARYG